jgi:hypothetical protein
MHKVCIGPSVFIVLLLTECVIPAISAGAEQAPTPSLLDLAKKTFGEQNLTAAERSLFESAQAGKGAFVPIKDASEANLETASTWSEGRVVHAERLAWLCTDPPAAALVSYSGLALYGMRIDGDLNLRDAEIKFPLYANKCAFTGKINLHYAQLRSLHFRTCIINGLQASGLHVAGLVSLSDGCKSQGEINLAGANIGGNLECKGSQLTNPSGKALNASGTNIHGYACLCAGFKADGEVNFVGATIGHDLNCGGAQLSTPSGKALNANKVKVNGSVFLSGAKTSGEINLLGATISGSLDCSGTELTNPQKYALGADGAKIEGGVFLTDGFQAEGGVRFLGAKIGGGLACNGAQLSNPNGRALNADSAEIHGGVFLCDGFKAQGEVNIVGAIADGVNCRRGYFCNANAIAIAAQGAKISGSVWFSDGFQSEGEVTLDEAKIVGNLWCVDAELWNPEADAFHANRTHIEGAVLLGTGFDAQGEVAFSGATLGGLTCHGAKISNPNRFALNAQGVTIRGPTVLRAGFSAAGGVIFASATLDRDLVIIDLINAERTIVDLRSVKVGGAFTDDAQSWPTEGNLLLDGFSYERIGADAPLDARSRVEWLHRQTRRKFLPQPYEQLASVLLKMGHESAAKEVMVQKNRDHGEYIARSFRQKNFLQNTSRFITQEWWWYNVFGKWIGYGYRPGRAFLASLAFILIGTVLFHLGYTHNVIVPTDDRAYHKYAGGQIVRSKGFVKEYPKFSAFMYSLESFVPLVKFDQSGHWAPNAKSGRRLLSLGWWKPREGSLLRGYLYLHIIAGWVLTTLWVGAITGLVKS